MTSRYASIIAIGVIVTAALACGDFITRSCERGTWVGLIPARHVSEPLAMRVGDTITFTSNYGTGDPTAGEGCDNLLYTSVERPNAFDFFSTDTDVVAITQLGKATATDTGRASVYAMTKGITGRSVVILVGPR